MRRDSAQKLAIIPKGLAETCGAVKRPGRPDDLPEGRNADHPLDSAIQEKLKATSTRMLASLTPREERVLRMRFGIGMNTEHTLEEVAQQFNVDPEAVRQIEEKALRKLKLPSRSRRLRSFMEQ